MNRVFADTSFFVALLNTEDDLHLLAVEIGSDLAEGITTSYWVLAELGNYLCAGPNRRLFVPFVQSLLEDSKIEILPGDEAAFQLGLD